MMKVFASLITCICFSICNLQSQSIEMLASGTNTSIRGLSVVSDSIIWVSGSRGTVGRSVNGGRSWTWLTVAGFEKTDFRDVQAWDGQTAVIMGVAEPAWILRTVDGGIHWSVVYHDTTRGVFLDAMDFLSNGYGRCVGDPIGGRLYELSTKDSGRSWQRMNPLQSPSLSEGEAFFASSGTNLRMLTDGSRMAVTGGKKSRLITDDQITDIPILQGGSSTGANSLAIRKSGRRILVVGGDFTKDKDTTGNCVLSMNKGRDWQKPVIGPKGYRSSVAFINSRMLIACGTSGVDLSTDGGRIWRKISDSSFHVVTKASHGNLIILAGAGGRIAKLCW